MHGLTIKFANSSLNITVVAFKVLPSYAPMPQRLVHPSKQFWNWFCGMTFRADAALFLMSSKCLQYFLSRPEQKKAVGG
jgi:hypothetical protein